MRCPNCEELVKDDAKVCYSCGENLKDYAVDSLIQEMIDEDTQNIKDSKKNKQEAETNTKKEKEKEKEKEKVVYGQAFRITAIITMLSIGLFLMSFLFDWFALSGRGAYIGFLDDGTYSYKTEVITEVPLDTILSMDEAIVLLEFSPRELYQYSKTNELVYQTIQDAQGEEKKYWTVIIQQIYIKGILFLPIMALLGIIIILIDRRFYLVEVVRVFSLLSMMIMLLNFLALKVPFFSMFAIRAKSVLQVGNSLNRVTMNMNGINLNNEFYPYNLIEKPSFYVGLVSCFIWFILATVLIEMKKDKNKQYG